MYEQRDFQLAEFELRSPGETGGDWYTMAGYAAVFGELSRPLYKPRVGEFRERIMPGSFARVLADKPDIHLCYEHDMASAMASTAAGTLELREDPRGLHVWARLDPEDWDVRRVVPKIKNRTAGQMSFKFLVGDGGDKLERRDLGDGKSELTRTITEFALVPEVSLVPQGAYTGTEASIRSFLAQINDDDAEARRDFSAAERKDAAQKGFALPDGSFPIKTTSDLKNAVQAFGRAKDKVAAREHIIKRARELGAISLLPKNWKMGLRSLDDGVEGLEDASHLTAGASEVREALLLQAQATRALFDI